MYHHNILGLTLVYFLQLFFKDSQENVCSYAQLTQTFLIKGLHNVKLVSFLLQVAYTKRDNIHKFIRKLVSLSYLPKEHIR